MIERDLAKNRILWSMVLDDTLSQSTGRALMQIAADELVRQLREDQDLRILIREMVADAVSKMNLQEVVSAAVAEVLKSSNAVAPKENSNG